jgi:hypothetical protein
MYIPSCELSYFLNEIKQVWGNVVDQPIDFLLVGRNDFYTRGHTFLRPQKII